MKNLVDLSSLVEDIEDGVLERRIFKGADFENKRENKEVTRVIDEAIEEEFLSDDDNEKEVREDFALEVQNIMKEP